MTTDLLSRVKQVPPVWWGAVAGAAAAGASIFPSSRVVAALVGGGAMLVLAVKVATPCCSECGEAAAVKAAEMRATTGLPVEQSPPITSGGLDEIFASGQGETKATFNPAKLLQQATTARNAGVVPSGGGGGGCEGCS